MNKGQLKKMLGYHVQLRPISKRYDGTQELSQLDDDWTVRRVDEVIELSNNRVPYSVSLGLDHIHSYTSNPGRGVGHGFLQLRVQLCLRGNDIDVEPLPPGQWK
jgi:hypothetical protein